MEPRILLLSRKWLGIGGMQRHTKDLWHGMQELYGERASLCAPQTRIQQLLFPVTAVARVIRAALCSEHLHLGDGALSMCAPLYKLLGGTHVSLTACGLDIVYPSKFYQWMLGRCLHSVDRVCCISKATAEEVRKRGVDVSKISVIPCGIWMDESLTVSSDTNTPRTLLMVGRLIERKGVLWFLKNVWPDLSRDILDLRCVIVGSGPDASHIKECMGDRIELHEHASDHERDAMFQHANLLVMPNIYVEGDMEGFGIVALEASGRGVPVAAARVEGVMDAVQEGKTGQFFVSGNPSDCVRVIRMMLAQPLSPALVSQATREQYGWPHLLPLYRDVFGL